MSDKTIAYYKNNSDNVEVIVKAIKTDTDPLGEILYQGFLFDCPAELDTLQIDIVGRSWVAEQEGKVLYYLEHIGECTHSPQ